MEQKVISKKNTQLTSLNQNGLSLVQALVAIAIAGSLGIGVFQIVLGGLKRSREYIRTAKASAVAQEIGYILSDSTSCTQTFQGIVPANGNVIDGILKHNPNNGTFLRYYMSASYAAGHGVSADSPFVVYGNNGLSISRMVLSSETPPFKRPVGANEAYLTIIFSTTDGMQESREDILIKTQAPNSTIVAPAINLCWSVSESENSVWEPSASDPTKIYYNTGAVGVGLGANNPDDAFSLHIGTKGFIANGNGEINGSLLVSNMNVSGNSKALSGNLLVNGTSQFQQLEVISQATVDIAGNLASQTFSSSGWVRVAGQLQASTGNIAGANLIGPGGYVTTQGGETTAVHFAASSDRRLKQNLKPIDNPLSKLAHIQTYKYTLKNLPTKKHIGVIAQQLQPHFPQLITKNKDDLLAVDYMGLSAVALEGIKALDQKVNALLNTYKDTTFKTGKK